jgi:aminoglycoside phosphotransferase (APT) family kinase protein
MDFTEIIKRTLPCGRLIKSWSLKGGISALMIAFEVQTPGGERKKFVLRQAGEESFKLNPGSIKNEYLLLMQLNTFGLKTQNPILFDESCETLPTPFEVLELVEGNIDFSTHDLSRKLDAMAHELATIHSLDIKQLDVDLLPAEVFMQDLKPETVETNEVMNEGEVREALSTCEAIAVNNKKSLLHGDYWPGNILWKDGTLAAVIDWEDAAIGDPLWDLAITRLDLYCIFGLDAMQQFTNSYRKLVDFDFSKQWYWDLNAALRFIRMAGSDLAGWAEFYTPYGRSDIIEQTLIERYKGFIDLAFEAKLII